MKGHSPAYRRSNFIHYERASAASSSSDDTIALMVASSSQASYSGVGTPQHVASWALLYPDVEMPPDARRWRREGVPPLSPGTPTHEPLEESPCSMTMAEVAREDRKQKWKKEDARVGRHGSGYKGP
jgi:hypothetical protein